MGKRGPKPTPTHILELRGSKLAKGRGDNPRPDPTPPPCPTWLDREARAEWRRIVPELERLGLLTRVDRAALTCYCQAWSELNDATRVLKRDGKYLHLGENGYLSPHPALAQQRAAWKTIKDFCALFGLDPSSRTGLHVPQAPREGLSGFARQREPAAVEKLPFQPAEGGKP
jgi:P27 family predicted phage terminase small subunit